MDHSGGYWALVGYLYQIVGVLDLIVRVESIEPGSTDAMMFMELTGVGGKIQAGHEQLGQDLALYAEDQTVLVQFKYSGSDNKIDQSDMGEIIAGFKDSLKVAKQRGEPVTACLLLTNRKLSQGAEELWKSSIQEFKGVNFRKSSEYELSTARENLEAFAQRYGLMDPGEIHPKLHTLIGEILERTRTEMIDFSLDDLKRVFTGSTNARQLTLEELRDVSTIDLEHFAEVTNLELVSAPFVRRGVMDDLNKHFATRALIVLHGGGGYGKTVTLWNWLQEQDCLRICKSTAQSISEFLISESLSDWMCLPATASRRQEQSNIALQRLRSANQDRFPPLYYLGIDGLDESISSQTEDALLRLIAWFWQEDRRAIQGDLPTATLLVTCREFSDFQDHWLRFADITGLSGKADIAHLSIDRFSDDEFMGALAIANLRPEIRDTIRNSLFDPSADLYSESFSPFDTFTTERTLSQIDYRMLKALQHPIVWSGFNALPEYVQNRVLQGKGDAWDELAKRFILRFLAKLRQRTKLDKNIALEALQTIARHCNADSSEWYRKQDSWIIPACTTGYWNTMQADTLYKEAKSHGVIEEQNQKWQWSYPWIASYLSIIQRASS